MKTTKTIKTYQILIREMMTIDRNLIIKATSKIDALFVSTLMADDGHYRRGVVTSRVVESFPLPKTLRRKLK